MTMRGSVKKACRLAFIVAFAGLTIRLPAMAGELGSPSPAHHRHLPDTPVRSTAGYVAPPVQLVRNDGRRVWLPDEIDDGRAVVLDFIYTTCTTVCSVSSQTFAALQERLGAERAHVHLMSISIDPEQDTPKRLDEYARRFDAGPQWQLYTGSAEASERVQQAFNAFRGSKMSHDPVMFLRAAPGAPWVRLDGFATVDELMNQLHRPVATR
jgi:protein SCO1/2